MSPHGPALLVFRPPVAGIQIPKGSVEPGESPFDAALRELAEESGIAAARVLRKIGYHEISVGAGAAETGALELQAWHTFLIAADAEIRDTWSHRVSGSEVEEGLVFDYFWLPIPEARRVTTSRFHASIDFVSSALGSAPTHSTERTLTLSKDSLAAAIASVATLRGEFTLRSGAVAHEYFDKYRFESDPALLQAVAEHLAPLIPPQSEVLAGLELGGVPIATALALRSGLRAVFVRKHAKAYGTRQLAEGLDVRGRRVLVIEDVVTSGGQVIASANDLRALGATVTDALCVIDRDSGGAAALAAAGITLHSVFTKLDLAIATSGSPRSGSDGRPYNDR